TDFGSFRPFPGFLRHPLTLQTDRSTVNGIGKKTGLFSTFPLVVVTFSLAQCEAVRSLDMGYALSGKTALVTGANRGLGEALAGPPGAAGQKKVYPPAPSIPSPDPLVARHGSRVTPLQLDVTNAAQITA